MASTRLNIHAPVAQIGLRKSKIWQASGDLRGEVITCSKGRLWITQANDLSDYVINAGESFWITRRGMVVVQALEDGQFTYSRVSPQPRSVAEAPWAHA